MRFVLTHLKERISKQVLKRIAKSHSEIARVYEPWRIEEFEKVLHSNNLFFKIIFFDYFHHFFEQIIEFSQYDIWETVL
jgi:hypothetical protein